MDVAEGDSGWAGVTVGSGGAKVGVGEDRGVDGVEVGVGEDGGAVGVLEGA